MARRKNHIEINYEAFEDLARRLEELGADLPEVVGDAMEEAGQKVMADTAAALSSGNLPAQGKYSDGDTAGSMVEPKVQWSGSLATLPLGFDKGKPGAGGFLITGTPKMAPDYALEKIYGTRKYEVDINNRIRQALQRAIDERIGG